QTQEAEREGKHQQYEARLAQAKASRSSAQVGRRFDGLRAVAEATRLAQELELGPESLLALRNEAITLMALIDVRQDSSWECFPPGGLETGVAFDSDMERYAFVDGNGHVCVRRLADNQELLRILDVGAPPATQRKPGWNRLLCFSPDGRYLAAGGGQD